jgi:hypothetical protein
VLTVEPAITWASTLFYRLFHHEPVLMSAHPPVRAVAWAASVKAFADPLTASTDKAVDDEPFANFARTDAPERQAKRFASAPSVSSAAGLGTR